MNQIDQIKDLQRQGLGPCENPEQLGSDRKTTAKYMNQEDFSAPAELRMSLPSKPDPWKSIIDILDDRKAITLKTWLQTQEKSDFTKLESVTMDMWDPFINAVKKNFKDAHKLITFDRFHVSQHFGKAVDKVRSEEHREFLAANGLSPLVRSKYQWLKNSQRTDNRSTRRKEFLQLTRLNLKTAGAWQIKEAVSTLWNYSYIGVAEKNWQQLLGWISRCRLKPVIAIGKMVRRYTSGES
jgi:transposase